MLIFITCYLKKEEHCLCQNSYFKSITKFNFLYCPRVLQVIYRKTSLYVLTIETVKILFLHEQNIPSYDALKFVNFTVLQKNTF